MLKQVRANEASVKVNQAARKAQLQALEDYRDLLKAEFEMTQRMNELLAASNRVQTFRSEAKSKNDTEVRVDQLSTVEKFLLVAEELRNEWIAKHDRRSTLSDAQFMQALAVALQLARENTPLPLHSRMLEAFYASQSSDLRPPKTLDQAVTLADVRKIARQESQLDHSTCLFDKMSYHDAFSAPDLRGRPVFTSATLWMDLNVIRSDPPQSDRFWELTTSASLVAEVTSVVTLAAEVYSGVGTVFASATLAEALSAISSLSIRALNMIKSSVSSYQDYEDLRQAQQTGEAGNADFQIQDKLSVPAMELLDLASNARMAGSLMRSANNPLVRSVLASSMKGLGADYRMRSLALAGLDKLEAFSDTWIIGSKTFPGFRLMKNCKDLSSMVNSSMEISATLRASSNRSLSFAEFCAIGKQSLKIAFARARLASRFTPKTVSRNSK